MAPSLFGPDPGLLTLPPPLLCAEVGGSLHPLLGPRPGQDCTPLSLHGAQSFITTQEPPGQGCRLPLRWGQGEGPAAVCGPTQPVWGERFPGSPRSPQVLETGGLSPLGG